MFKHHLEVATGAAILLIASAGAQVKIGAKGTTQMAGADGKFLRPYSLGVKGNQLNFTLKSIEYTIEPVSIGTNTVTPGAGEKLMVVRFNIHNCEKRQQYCSAGDFSLTAVEATDKTVMPSNGFGMETTKLAVAMYLKPAQKIDAYAIFKVTSQGEIPKLIVKRAVEPVVRYNLTGKAKLPAKYADPADATGATVLANAEGQLGTPVISGYFEINYIKVGEAAATFGGVKARKGFMLVPIEITVKNLASAKRYLNGNKCNLKLEANDYKATIKKDLVDKFGESASQYVEPGKSVSGWILVEMKEGDSLKTATFETEDKRVYTFTF